MMDISFSSEFGYMSPPTTTTSANSQEMCFYSAPTSPNRIKKLSALTTTPRTHDEDAYSNLDEFEFETSRRFNPSNLYLDTETWQKDDEKPIFDHQQQQEYHHHHHQRLCGDDSIIPTMAFADELFCDGKVLPILPPLKLPPRLLLQNGDGNLMMSTPSSRVTSPRSPGSMLRLPFSRHSLWNDEFDPFMVALEKVRREEKRGKQKENNGLRRTRSLSPFRGFNNRYDRHVGLSEYSKQQLESHCFELHQKEPLKKQASSRTNMPSQTKGLVLSREVRMVRVDNDATFESKLALETKKDERKRVGFLRKKKSQNIMKFLFGNAANMGKGSSQHRLEDQKAALVRKLDKKAMSSTQSTKRDDKDEATHDDMNKMRLVCHKPRGPRLFLCLG